MTTDLEYLAFTAILTAALWIPYVIAQAPGRIVQNRMLHKFNLPLRADASKSV